MNGSQLLIECVVNIQFNHDRPDLMRVDILPLQLGNTAVCDVIPIKRTRFKQDRAALCVLHVSFLHQYSKALISHGRTSSNYSSGRYELISSFWL